MTTKTPRAKRKPAAPDPKAAWKKLSDKGPHKATLPSGIEVTFVVPDSSALIRAEMLPDRLAEIAIMAAAYPDGAEGYLADMGMRAIGDPEEAGKLKHAVKDGMELRDWLVSQMLVAPKLTPEEVGSGDFPEADIAMLIELAERRRNSDAKGVLVPIAVLEEYQTFRGEPDSREDEAAGGDGPDAAAGAAGGTD